jgi:hypothetical protein
MPKRLTKETLAVITDLAERQGVDGVQIAKHLEELVKEGTPGIETVHPRTIQKITRKVKYVDPSGPWRLTDPEPVVDAAVVMRVLGDVVFMTNGRRRYFTKAEAVLISKIGGMNPFAPGFHVFTLAREYIRRQERDEPTEDLDMVVAFAVPVPARSPTPITQPDEIEEKEERE